MYNIYIIIYIYIIDIIYYIYYILYLIYPICYMICIKIMQHLRPTRLYIFRAGVYPQYRASMRPYHGN